MVSWAHLAKTSTVTASASGGWMISRFWPRSVESMLVEHGVKDVEVADHPPFVQSLTFEDDLQAVLVLVQLPLRARVARHDVLSRELDGGADLEHA